MAPRIFCAAFALVSINTVARAGEPTKLFAGDDPIEVTLAGPIGDLVRKAPHSTDPYPATLSYAAETHAIELSARGRSRRDRQVCQFPPLRVKFVEKPAEGSLFHKQRKLKLVTHCRKTAHYQQFYLLEYASYKLLNLMTPASFKVRLVNLAYIDSKKGKTIIERTGFFIEDVDDLAKRVGMKEVERPGFALSQYDRTALAQVALFHYMIGNLDWSVLDGAASEDCCHNGKVIGANEEAQAALLSAPYDFDHAGLVDAPYATPPHGLSLRNVRIRSYRGFCALNAETRAAAAEIRARREEFFAAIVATPGLSERSVAKASRYLEGFFQDIASDEAVEKNLLRHCRK